MLDHEAVADAAVIGVTRDHEEHPRAYIVLAQGKTATEEDIQNFMKQHVTRTKWLTGGVRFVQAIPKNPVSAMLIHLDSMLTFSIVRKDITKGLAR